MMRSDTLKNLFNARPIGQALLIFLLAHAAISALVLHLSPSQLSADYYLSPGLISHGDVPVNIPVSASELMRYNKAGCRLQRDEESGLGDAESKVFRLSCIEKDLDKKIYGNNPLRAIRLELERSRVWKLDSYTFSIKNVYAPVLSGLLYSGLMIFSFFLIRDLQFQPDLKEAVLSIRTAPWILFICPISSALVFLSISLIFPPIEHELQPALEIFQAIVPEVWVIVIVFPFLEEALFRQWAYVRTIQYFKPATVAIGTAWVFMLAHIFNPQVSAVPAFLPTIFVAGLVFFWIRYRFNSFFLAYFSHVFHNALTIAFAGWLGDLLSA